MRGSEEGWVSLAGTAGLKNRRYLLAVQSKLRSLTGMGASFKTGLRAYRDSHQGIGCRTGCMIHLALLGIIALALVFWAVKNRIWELEVTIELPAKAKTSSDQEKSPPR